MGATTQEAEGISRAGRGAQVEVQKSTLRDNLESIAIAILLVLVVRQLVVEAFKIPTGSMALTLLGEHKEVRCPNCGWVFAVGRNSTSGEATVVCPNCMYRWDGASGYYRGRLCSGRLNFRRPAWLWHRGFSRQCDAEVIGGEAANRVLRAGSRIFVNKFIYRLRKPRRWEVIVFLYPFYKASCESCDWKWDVKRVEGSTCPVCGSEEISVERRNFIKRLIGLPNEKVGILNGDIYINGEIARKPPAIQERMWMHVFDSRFMPKRKEGPLWSFGENSWLWKSGKERGSLVLNTLGIERPITAAFGREITDHCSYNGTRRWDLQRGADLSSHEVGDCRVAVTLTALECDQPGRAAAVLRIIEDGHDFALSVPVGQAGPLVLRDGHEVLTEARVTGLRKGRRTRILFENYDDRLVVKLRGKTVLSYEYGGNPVPETRRKSVQFGGCGSRLLFERILIQRDMYYVDRNGAADTQRTYELGEKQYFVLGDNSSQSSDSRYWSYVPEDNVVGEAFFVFWPIHQFRFLSFGAGE